MTGMENISTIRLATSTRGIRVLSTDQLCDFEFHRENASEPATPPLTDVCGQYSVVYLLHRYISGAPARRTVACKKVKGQYLLCLQLTW